MLNLRDIIEDTRVTSESGKTIFSLRSSKVEDGFEVNYVTGAGTFETTKIIIPEKIELSKETFITFGLLQAESTKKPHYATFDFTNSNPELVEFFLNYWEKDWKLPREKWKARILLWNSLDLDAARNFWEQKLRVDTNIQRGTAYRISDLATKTGVCHLLLANKSLRAVVLEVHERIKKEILTDRNKAVFYLSGLLAGDGSVIAGEGKAIVELCLNPNSDEPRFYRSLLESLGLEISEAAFRTYDTKRYIRISGYKNLLKLFMLSEAELFLPDKTKNKKLLKALLQNQYLITFWRIALLPDTFTAREYAEKFTVVKRTANQNILRLIEEGLVEKKAASLPAYSITPKGKRLIEIAEKARNIIEEN